MLSEKTENALKAFHQYRMTHDKAVIVHLTLQDMEEILNELSRYTSDWFYPIMVRWYETLRPNVPYVQPIEPAKEKWYRRILRQ